MKFVGYKQIKGIIEIISGLHVGGNAPIIEIGGQDNPVIKHPITKEPYIPGSSIKGKMRSLLEWKLGKLNTDFSSDDFGNVHKWCNDIECPICLIFGTSAEDAGIGPTRLIVRDAVIENEFKAKLKRENINWTPLDLLEDKWENNINRITAAANPRNFERVVSGTLFSFSMSYKVFENLNDKDGNTDENLFKHILEGLRLLEKDALGGAGSRGCGQVRFRINVNGDMKNLDQVTAADFETVA